MSRKPCRAHRPAAHTTHQRHNARRCHGRTPPLGAVIPHAVSAPRAELLWFHIPAPSIRHITRMTRDNLCKIVFCVSAHTHHAGYLWVHFTILAAHHHHATELTIESTDANIGCGVSNSEKECSTERRASRKHLPR